MFIVWHHGAPFCLPPEPERDCREGGRGRKRAEVAANKLSVIKAAKRRRSLCRMSRKGASGGAAVVKLITASLRRCSQEGWRQSSGRRRSTWEQRHVAGRFLPHLPPPTIPKVNAGFKASILFLTYSFIYFSWILVEWQCTIEMLKKPQQTSSTGVLHTMAP